MDPLVIVGKHLAHDERIVRFLEREGYRVLTAPTPAKARPILQTAHPAVAIVEHDPGEVDGLELLKEVRAQYPACEVILVTPGGEMELAIETLRAGALDYLRLPVDLEQLRVALGRVNERHRQHRVAEPASILVLEDHEPTRRRLAHSLEKEGFRVASAIDGVEGERLLQETRIDLVITDLKMPRKDGLTLLHETRQAGLDVEFIVMTGYGDEDTVVQALRDGALNFLRKPLDLDQMLLAIQKALDYQTIRRSLAYRNRELELMHEFVVRLTRKLEIVVERPGSLGPEMTRFLDRLVNSLPLGIAVVAADRNILFANRHVIERAGAIPTRLSAKWLETVGLATVTELELDEVFQRTIGKRLGTIETLTLSSRSFVLMTPLRLVGPDTSAQYVALVIRGERQQGPA